MPVRKFRSVEEMEDSAWLEPDDPRLPRAIRLCWEMAARIAPRHFPPGVYKHRTMKSLNDLSERWEAAGRPG